MASPITFQIKPWQVSLKLWTKRVSGLSLLTVSATRYRSRDMKIPIRQYGGSVSADSMSYVLSTGDQRERDSSVRLQLWGSLPTTSYLCQISSVQRSGRESSLTLAGQLRTPFF